MLMTSSEPAEMRGDVADDALDLAAVGDIELPRPC
jgi:hypothetical protein